MQLPSYNAVFAPENETLGAGNTFFWDDFLNVLDG
jgi:hypothetical protein